MAGGIPGSAELYVLRPAGAGYQEAQARRGRMGRLSPKSWTAASPATTCPTHPKTQLWRPWRTWAVPGGSLRPSSRLIKATWGWTELRDPDMGGMASPHSHVPAGGSVPAGPAAGLGEKRCPVSPVRRCTGWWVRCCPGRQFGPEELLLWLKESQLRNERARRSHERRRSARREGRMDPPP